MDSCKILGFPDLIGRIVFLKDLNCHQLAQKEISEDTRFFIETGHEFQYLIDHNSSGDDGNDDFYPIVCTHWGETKALHLKFDGPDMIRAIFDSKSPRALF